MPVARTLSALEELADEIRAGGGRAEPVAVDVGDPTSIERGVEAVAGAFGRLTSSSTMPGSRYPVAPRR